ncbi:MAG: hypothetical protein KJ950_15245 [Proteobacteria bacterium]|nr:hypothetical protein [Pseudomonadota bacterium]MBU1686880.1 hypothetical protein [Pseudomonadota bacterium]
MFRDECDNCGRDLHICINCSFYDPHASRECREPAIPDSVHDKERKNLCEYFQPVKEGQRPDGDSAPDEARRRLEALFK